MNAKYPYKTAHNQLLDSIFTHSFISYKQGYNNKSHMRVATHTQKNIYNIPGLQDIIMVYKCVYQKNNENIMANLSCFNNKHKCLKYITNFFYKMKTNILHIHICIEYKYILTYPYILWNMIHTHMKWSNCSYVTIRIKIIFYSKRFWLAFKNGSKK